MASGNKVRSGPEAMITSVSGLMTNSNIQYYQLFKRFVEKGVQDHAMLTPEQM